MLSEGSRECQSAFKLKIPMSEIIFCSSLMVFITYGFVIEPEALPRNMYSKLESLENIQPDEHDIVAYFNLMMRRSVMDKYPNSVFHN